MKYKLSLYGHLYRIVSVILLSFIPNSLAFFDVLDIWIFSPIMIPLFILLNIFPSTVKKGYPSFRVRMCSHGNELLRYYCISSIVCLVYQIWFINWISPQNNFSAIVFSLLICIICQGILLLNALISIFCTSVQIGIKYRILTLIFCLIPVIRWILFIRMIRIVSAEVNLETNKNLLYLKRKEEKVCATKYPILLVHGVFFRDSKYLNYWGRIPDELTRNGAKIYYGNHQSALSIEESGKELAQRIQYIVNSTGCEKMNIIAHSKGGLDCRYAISRLGCDKYVATLTTVNTPHRGCQFAEYLLEKLPQNVTDGIAAKYNAALKKLGDTSPDFISAVSCLTSSYCKTFNETVKDSPQVSYRSIGSKLNRATGGTFPLNFSYNLVKFFDGENDGLVAATSFPYGEQYTYLQTNGRRGISHADVIDLNRENIRNFDVREFYVELLHNLKKQGY